MGALRHTVRLIWLLGLLHLGTSSYFYVGKKNAIVDELGRTRLFHGVNAVEKLPPFLPSATGSGGSVLNDDDIAALASWGFNVVRLGVLWEATVPEKAGEVNATYLEGVRDTVSRLHGAGISTLVDMHQDVLSGFLCGEGMPDWALLEALELAGFDKDGPRAFPAPLRFEGLTPDNTTGKPPLSECQKHPFFRYYVTFESEAAWAALYGSPVMWEHFGDHWAAVVSALHGAPGLLGYEMINEPWPSKGANGSSRVLSDADVLMPLYTRLYERVRQAEAEAQRREEGASSSSSSSSTTTSSSSLSTTNNATVPGLFFFEPLVLGSYLDLLPKHTTSFPPGGPAAAAASVAGNAPVNSTVLAYHSYCASQDDGSPMEQFGLCRVLVRSAWDGVQRNLAQLGPDVGGFLTEFGAVGDDDMSLELLRLQTEGADAALQSWAYWTYKGFDDITTQNVHTETFFVSNASSEHDVTRAGSLQSTKVKALARTYARAVAGTPTRMVFNTSSAAFELAYSTASPATTAGAAAAGTAAAAATTEIFLHTGFWYPEGFVVHAEATVGDGDDSSQPPEVTWSTLAHGPGPMQGGDQQEGVDTWVVLGFVVEEAATADSAPVDVTVRIEKVPAATRAP